MAPSKFSSALPLIFIALALGLWGLALFGYVSRGRSPWSDVVAGLFCLFFALLTGRPVKRSSGGEG